MSTAGRRTLRQKLGRLRSRHILHAYLFIAPVILLFGLFRILPSVQTLLYSFFKVELIRGRFTFIGLDNFRDLLTDEIFQRATINTLKYVVTIVPISAILGLLLAVLFNARFRFQEFFKAVYFSPMVTSTVAAAMVWWWMYNPQFGIFNVLLKLAGVPRATLAHVQPHRPDIHHHLQHLEDPGVQHDHLPGRPSGYPAAVLRSRHHRRGGPCRAVFPVTISYSPPPRPSL